jgi:hypothetical protein
MVDACAGTFEYPFVNKWRTGGKQRYLKEKKWPILSACHILCLVESSGLLSLYQYRYDRIP